MIVLRIAQDSRVRVHAATAVLLALCSFAALPDMGQEPSAHAQGASGPVAQASALLTDVDRTGGHALEFWIRRAERPRTTVIFENGLMLSLDTWSVAWCWRMLCRHGH